MPPGKRSRRQISDQSSSETEHQGPSAQSKRNNIKRQRRSSTPVNDEDDEDDDDDDDDDNDDDDALLNPSEQTQADVTDDDEDDNEEAIEASTQRATREIVAKNSKNTQNTPADFGIVTAMELENFMCHTHLEVKLGPLINFIIGHNGSGKSAILTGLTLCLGGKATSTNRGSSLKTFIKEGQSQARITLKLKNGGDGYKTDVYGDLIIIERSFTREGGSSYKIKTKHNKLVSTKREELDEICDYMGLQVDNPMNVLTQDAARQFINNSSEREKYKFFIKGVQLEQLHQDYRLLIDSIMNTEATLETKKSDLVLLKKQMQEAKHKHILCKGQQQLRQKRTQLGYQMAWIQVADQEKALEKLAVIIKETDDKIEEIKEKIEEAERVFDETNTARDSAGASLASESDKLKPIEEEEFQIKEKMDNNKRELLKIQADLRDAHNQVQSQRTRIASTEAKKQQEEQRLINIDGGSNARLVSSKEEKISERKRLGDQSNQLEAEHETQKTQLTAAKENSQQIKRQVQAKQKEINHTRSRQQDLRRVQSEYMHAYGDNMLNLLKAIDEEARRGKWMEKPIGPLGQHITLLKQDWSLILETIFGNGLSGFVVTSYEDQTLLRTLMNRLHCNFPVAICKNTPIKLLTPDERYNTILRALEISDPLIQKYLVIQYGIEQALLFDDQEDANIAWSTVTEQNHQNIQVCYAKNQGRRGWGLRIGGKIGGNAVKPVRAWERAPRMKTDLNSQIREINYELEQLQQELNELHVLQRDKDRILVELQMNLQSFDTRKQNLRIRSQRLEDEIEKIANKIEENVADSRLGTLEVQLEAHKKDLEAEEQVYVELAASRNLLLEEQGSLQKDLNNVKNQLEAARFAVRQQEQELSDAMGKRQQALNDKNYWHKKLEAVQANRNQQQEQYNELEGIVTEFTTKANAVCSRVEIPRGATGPKLNQTLKKITEELDESERRIGGTPDEIARAAEIATTNYTNARHDLIQIQHLLEVMKQSYKDRTARWKKFRHYISARARAQFMWLMSQRAYRGRLRIDHDKQELKLEVQPSQQESEAGRGPKTLSGGERSFSTVCLLLSLWEAMGSPIRCLDEFDVFMDSVNRAVSVKLMIEAARRSIGKQFILITPQDMSSIDSSADVKVTRLMDPERNQSSLNIARG